MDEVAFVFVDDLISVMVVGKLATLRSWIAHVVGIFEQFGLKANVGKLEIIVHAMGKGSRKMNRVRSKLAWGKPSAHEIGGAGVVTPRPFPEAETSAVGSPGFLRGGIRA